MKYSPFINIAPITLGASLYKYYIDYKSLLYLYFFS